MTSLSPTAAIAAPAPAQASHRAMTIFSVLAAVTFSASSSAPTPLYRLYQQGLGLSPALVTLIFAVYAFSLLGALLTLGSLSDYVGRRPVIFAALLLNAAAMILFAHAHSASMLMAARAVQGFATGAATTALGAAILDTDRARGPLYNSLTAFGGLTVGALGSGALVAFAPDPMQTIYVVLLVVTLFEIVALSRMPETSTAKAGAWASLRPRLSAPPQARGALVRTMPVNIAAWALGGFYLSLMPSLVRAATGLTSPFVGAVTVATLMLVALSAVALLRQWAPARLLRLGGAGLAIGVAMVLAGVRVGHVEILLLGTLVAGVGFGAAFSGNLRTLLPLTPPQERAGLLSVFYVVSYLAFSIPAILAGLGAPVLGLRLTATVYGAVVIGLALASLAAEARLGRPT
jgi:MFS family permease